MSSAFMSSYWGCKYDELITFYPRFYRDVLEMDAILRIEGSLADGIDEGMNLILTNNFIDTMDEDTIAILEKYLGLSLLKSRTLDERRRLVRSYFAGMGKVSATSISELIRAYTGAETTCTFLIFDEEGNCRLDVIFERGEEATLYWSDIYTLLDKMLPAHIEYRAMVSYTPAAVVVDKSRAHYKTGYPVSGTLYETQLIADINTVEAVVESDVTPVKMDYMTASENGESGKYPTSTALADINTVDTGAEVASTTASVDYMLCGTNYAGTGG